MLLFLQGSTWLFISVAMLPIETDSLMSLNISVCWWFFNVYLKDWFLPYTLSLPGGEINVSDLKCPPNRILDSFSTQTSKWLCPTSQSAQSPQKISPSTQISNRNPGRYSWWLLTFNLQSNQLEVPKLHSFWRYQIHLVLDLHCPSLVTLPPYSNLLTGLPAFSYSRLQNVINVRSLHAPHFL